MLEDCVNIKLNIKNFCIRNVIYFLIVFFTIFSSALPGITIPGIGLLYPFRLIIPFLMLYIILFEKDVGGYSNLEKDTIILFLIMMVASFVTFIWARDKSAAIKQIVSYIFCLTFVIAMLRIVRDKESFYQIIIYCMYIMIILMIMGLYESFTGNYFFDNSWSEFKPYREYNFYYPVVHFSNPNDFVFVIFGLMPFVNVVTKYHYKPKSIYGHIVRCVYFGLYCMITVLANCKMGILLIPVSIVIRLFFVKNRTIKTLYPFMLVFAICFFVIWQFDYIKDLLEKEVRFVIWANILRNAWYYKFMGTGLANSYLPIPGVQYVGTLMIPHSWFIEIFAELGIFVFLFIIIWYIMCMSRAVKKYKKAINEEDREIRITSMMFFLGFILMSCMVSSIAVLPQFWLILVLALTAINIDNSAEYRGNYL